MMPEFLLIRRWLLLCCLITAALATACGTLHVAVDVAPTAESTAGPDVPPLLTAPKAEPPAGPDVPPMPTALTTEPPARPGVPLTPTAWFSELPPWANEAGATFDDRMKLIGFTVEPPDVGPGSVITVTLIWRVLDEIDAEYNTFVHVVNEAGQLLAQSDRPTGLGYREPTSWIIDELIYDQHSLMLPASKTLNEVEIRIGLYDFASGQRAGLDSSNSYTISEVTTPTPKVTPTPLPTPRAIRTPLSDETESAPQQDLADLRVAYNKDGDVWLWESGSGPLQLIKSGGVDRVWLSDDGQKVAFTHNRDIWVVNSDGSDARQLTRAEDFLGLSIDEETDLDETGVFPFQVEWRPGSHELYFNLHPNVEGIDLRLLHDLWMVDAGSGELSMILPPGEGGKFYFSPDSERLAIVTKGQIDLMDADGANRREAFSHELDHYSVAVWSPDSSSLRVAIPPDDDYVPGNETQPTSIWFIPWEDQPARQIGEVIARDALRVPPNFAPDLARFAYLISENPDQPDSDLLGVAISELSASKIWDPALYPAKAHYIRGWSPDGMRLHFDSLDVGVAEIKVGQPGVEPLIGGENKGIYKLIWIDDSRFLYERHVDSGWQLLLGQVDQGDPELIDSPRQSVSFDFAWLPAETAENQN